MKKGRQEEVAKIGIFPHCRKRICARYMGIFRELCKNSAIYLEDSGFLFIFAAYKKEIVKEVQCRIAVLEDCFFLYFFFRASGMDTFLKQSPACEVSWVANGRKQLDIFKSGIRKITTLGDCVYRENCVLLQPT